MAICKIGEFKLSLHMNEFRSEVRFPTFDCLFVCLFFSRTLKAAPTKVKANRRKSRTLVYRVSVKINLKKKFIYEKFPSLVCLLQGESERAAVCKAVITVPIIPAHILFSAQTLNEYLYVDVCNNLLRHI